MKYASPPVGTGLPPCAVCSIVHFPRSPTKKFPLNLLHSSCENSIMSVSYTHLTLPTTERV